MATAEEGNSLQFYDFKLESDLTTDAWVTPFVNNIYNKIINYDPIKPIHYEMDYEKDLDQVREQESPRAWFGLLTRAWFKKVKLMVRDQTETTVTERWVTDFYITDAQTLDWHRYLYVVFDSFTKVKIFKQILTNKFECSWDVRSDVNEWTFVDISKYSYKDFQTGNNIDLTYYPTSKCIYDRLVITQWGKWPLKDFWSWYMQAELQWDDVFNYFFDENKTINAWSWDYMYIRDWPYSWQILPIAMHNPHIEYQWDIYPWVTMLWVFAGMYLKDNETKTDWPKHSYQIFPDYWEILNFACSDWIIHIHSSGEKPSETIFTNEWAAHWNTNNNSTDPSSIISWMTYYPNMDSICYFDSKDWELQYWLTWRLKFYFKSTNSFFAWKKYTDVVAFQDYLILIWPKRTAMAYPYQETPWSITNLFYILWHNKWYYDKRSYEVEDDNLYIVTNTKKLYGLGIEVSNTMEKRFTAKWIWAYQPWPIIEDLSMLNSMTDRVGVSVFDKELKVFISNDKWTKIMIMNTEHKFWRTYMTHLKIHNRREQCRMWKWLYVNKWLNDDWIDFKTIISFQFWDKTMHFPKTARMLKLSIGRRSYISEDNTLLVHTYDFWWWKNRNIYKDFNRAWWIQWMMRLKNSWLTDDLVKIYPIGIQIDSGNWHWKISEVEDWNYNNIDSYLKYNPVGSSDLKTQYNYTLSNMCEFELPIEIPFDIATFEIVGRWWDILEYYWAVLWYDIFSIWTTRLENVLTLHDREPSGELLTRNNWQ